MSNISVETKLKIAGEEIKDILKKYDLAGVIVLHTPTKCDWFMHFNTSYSCLYQYNDSEVRFYSKLKDYKSKKEQMQKQSNTANMLHMMQHVSGEIFQNLNRFSKIIDEETNAKHF